MIGLDAAAAGGPSASLESLDITADGSVDPGDPSSGPIGGLSSCRSRRGECAPSQGPQAPTQRRSRVTGKTVVFSTSQGVYRVAPSSGTLAEIVDTPAGSTDALARVSPDGRTVAFARTTQLANGDDATSVQVVPAAGGTVRQVATDVLTARSAGGGLAFSPDGTRLLYVGDDTRPGIWSVPTSGGAAVALTGDLDYWPVFVDASTVLFARSSTSPNADASADTPRFPARTTCTSSDRAGRRRHCHGHRRGRLRDACSPAPSGRGDRRAGDSAGGRQPLPPLRAQAVVAAGGFPIGVTCKAACTVKSVLVGVIRRHGRSLAAKVPQWGSASASLPRGGRAKLFVRLNAKAKKAFAAKRGSFTLTLTNDGSVAGRQPHGLAACPL